MEGRRLAALSSCGSTLTKALIRPIARWMAEHPDRPDPRTDAALVVYLISWQREWAAEGAAA